MSDVTNADIYLICGSGGVGKTTVSAALGLKLAGEGLKTAVLTVDPAKRLATSLGLDSIGDEPQKIANGGKSGGALFAMMLDTKRTFDRLVERHAPNAAARDRIFNNKVYQHLSGMLAGSQEYMAMERLLEIVKLGAYDAIVVDTPPMQNAMEFLEAPDRMRRMIGDSMLHLLIKPSLAVSKVGFKIFEKGAQQILKIMDRIVGFAFLQDISEMLIAFQDMLVGFDERATAVHALIKAPGTRFIVVCAPQENALAETKNFAERLKGMGCRLNKIIANRVYPGTALSKDKIETDEKKLVKLCGTDVARLLVDNYREHLPLIKKDLKLCDGMAQIVGLENLVTVPLFLSDVHDVTGLKEIAKRLAI